MVKLQEKICVFAYKFYARFTIVSHPHKEIMMYPHEIAEINLPSTPVEIKYDCDGGFERCGKLWTLKYKDAQKNFEKNNKKHVCRQCSLKNNNPASDPKVRAKMKKTCLERYGTEMPLNSEDNIATRMEKMFGTESSTQDIVDKRKKTSKERYGTDHPMQNDDIKTKHQAVMIEKYGVPVPLQNEEIKAKMQQTVLDRYGVTNIAMLPEVQVKMSKTMLENYGVEHYNKLPEMKQYLREHCVEWLKESWESGGPNKGIIRPEEWNEKQRQTVMRLIDSGKWNSGPKSSIKGKYKSNKCRRKNPMFRSSYELKVHWFFDNDPKTEWYDYEPFRISYYDTERKLRYYIVDFIVKYKGKQPKAIEVKNDYGKVRFIECGKEQAFREACSDLCLEVWSNQEISDLKLSLDDLLKSPLVEIL